LQDPGFPRRCARRPRHDGAPINTPDIDWATVYEHGRKAANVLAGGDDPKALLQRAESLIDDVFSEAEQRHK
jgi:hypothetical protein